MEDDFKIIGKVRMQPVGPEFYERHAANAKVMEDVLGYTEANLERPTLEELREQIRAEDRAYQYLLDCQKQARREKRKLKRKLTKVLKEKEAQAEAYTVRTFGERIGQ